MLKVNVAKLMQNSYDETETATRLTGQLSTLPLNFSKKAAS